MSHTARQALPRPRGPLRAFLGGWAGAFRGLGLLTQPGVRPYVVIPLVINTLLFAAATAYAVTSLDQFLAWLLPGWLGWLEWLLWPVFGLGWLITVFYTFTLVANLIGAPFNGYLAAAVERRLGKAAPPQQPGPGMGGLLREAAGALADELRKLVYFAAWALPLLLLFLIPGINLMAPFAWLIYTAWMLALEYADPHLGNHGLVFKAQRAYLAGDPGRTLGFGLGMVVLTLVPGLNFLAMPAGVAAATALWHPQGGPGQDPQAGNAASGREKGP